jgi:hypothetical protein
MAIGSPYCLSLYDGADPRNAHRALQSAGLVGQNLTVIKGVVANAEGSKQVGDTFRGTKLLSISMDSENREEAMIIKLILSYQLTYLRGELSKLPRFGYNFPAAES